STARCDPAARGRPGRERVSDTSQGASLDIIRAMAFAPGSRRQFIATGSALVAAGCIPAWAEIFQAGPAEDAVRAEAAEAALARAAALGASYADIRINRYRRESIATRERQVQNVSR